MGAIGISPGKTIKYQERPYNAKFVQWMCALLAVLVVLRAINDAFLYAFMIVSAVVFITCSTSQCLPLLFFLLPVATILKTDPDSMSFHTVLTFLTILRMAIIQRKITQNLVGAVMIFCFYNLLFSGMGQLTTIITIAAGFLLLYCARYKTVDVSRIVSMYALGICLASVLGLLREELPIINTFVKELTIKLGENNYAARFSGLHGNPNYYSMDISVVMAAIIVLMYNKKAKTIHMLLLVALALFGIMTVSKSFLLASAVLMVCWIGLSLKQGVKDIFRNIMIALLGVLVLYLFSADAINTYIERLLQDQSASLADVTTGRTDIWMTYLEAIFDDMKIFMFGNGLNTIAANTEAGSHNTYLEVLFMLGCSGTVLLVSALWNSMGRLWLKNGIWVVLLIILVRMLAISMLTYDNLWFYLAILVMMSSDCAPPNYCRTIGGIRR